MSDNENQETEEKPFCIERAKQGRANCKKCKQKCLTGELRIAKLAANPFGDGKMKMWHHVSCLFDQFLAQRATTKRIENSDDIDGWDNLDGNDQEELLKCIEESEKKIAEKHGKKYSPKKPVQPKAKKTPPNDTPTKKKGGQNDATSTNKKVTTNKTETNKTTNDVAVPKDHKDNLFREFRRLITDVMNENSYLEKSAIIKNMLTKGTDGKSFKGDVILWCRLLIPGVIKRIYNLQSKQLVKLFSEMFATNREEMLEHLEQGDIGETIQHFFENSDSIKPAKKSTLTLQEVDDFLEELSKLTKEDEQIFHFKKTVKKCTANDLKIIIRLIKHDLRMNAGAKHVLDAIHPDAYEAFQASRNLDQVLSRILDNKDSLCTSESKVKISINVMTPVLPMLAEACKSVEQAMKKCPNGMYSEIKYDGERVQVHKQGSDFKYYSRSLKPVLPHKVNHFKEYIPQAFPYGNDLILDSEVLLIDTENGKPLPFGSLGKHKKEEFSNANVCLFVFDCIYYNGESLMHKPIKERRKILKENMIEIPNHILFSESEIVHKAKDLAAMIAKVLQLGLEGLVLKDLMSIYEPGKRHWLKVKKDYLCDGAMADTADLIVLGAWFGTGKKGGMMSVFLMGCYDKFTKKFLTVTKVHTGHDDKTLEQLQTELDMIKISGESSKVPDWLKCTRSMIPDFVARDPKKQPVWEITGAEFTQHEVHTADGISIRFPRVTRIRSDKTWETATNLKELKTLYTNSTQNVDYDKLLNIKDDSDEPSTSTSTRTSNQGKIDDYMNKKVKIKKEDSDTEKTTVKRKSTSIDKKSPKKIKTEKKESDIRFPEIFKNIHLLPQDGVDESMLRNFIAHGGDLLTVDNWLEATHVVHESNSVKEIPECCPRTARHVTVDWIKDCIGNNEIQDTRPYSVTWMPL